MTDHDRRFRRRPSTPTIAVLATLVVLGAATLALVYSRKAPPQSPSGQLVSSGAVQHTLRQLTRGPGRPRGVTWSSDNHTIAFSSNRSGNFDIWTQRVGAAEPVQLTFSPDDEVEPDWSPDGSTIAFRSTRGGGGIFTIPALGGAERQVADFGAFPRWSPDGSKLLILPKPHESNVERSPGMLRSVLEFGALLEDPAIYIIEDGQKPHRLPGIRGAGYPLGQRAAWHPDGRISVLAGGPDGKPSVHTFPVDGLGRISTFSVPDTLGTVPPMGGSIIVEWGPDGRSFFLTDPNDDPPAIWQMQVDPVAGKTLSQRRLKAGSMSASSLSVSRDGRRLAFAVQSELSQLWVYPFDDVAGVMRGNGRLVTLDSVDALSSDLSPDGRFVAVEVRRRDSNREELWIVSLDTMDTEIVGRDVVSRYSPRWSPSGRQLVYFVGSPRAELVVREASGAERAIAVRPLGLMPSDWTADERFVLASLVRMGQPASATTWRADVTTPQDEPARVLIDDEHANIWQSRLSPDGRWMSFVFESVPSPEKRSTPPHVLVHTQGLALARASSATSRDGWTVLAGELAWVDKPRWSRDGKTLYFLGRQEGEPLNLWGVRFDPATGQPVDTPFQITKFGSSGPRISPFVDQTEMSVGRGRLLLSMISATGDIWMLDNVDK